MSNFRRYRSGLWLSDQKPRVHRCDPGTIASNCARMGLPMPVLAMPMWENAGNIVYDYSGQGNHGTLSAGVLWSGGNLLMDGDDKVTLSSKIEFSDSDAWSVVGLLYDTDTVDTYCFWIGDTAPGNLFTLRHSGDNLKFKGTGIYNPLGSDESLAPYKNIWTSSNLTIKLPII